MGYRPNVCVVITDSEAARVLLFRRVDETLGAQRWQFPQGGLKPDESPEVGMRRELLEEIGTDRVEVLKILPHPIRYDYPPEVLQTLAATKPKMAGYIGQEQRWFLVRLEMGEAQINFSHQPAEFDTYRWATPAEALAEVVPFKHPAYIEALTAFGFTDLEA